MPRKNAKPTNESNKFVLFEVGYEHSHKKNSKDFKFLGFLFLLFNIRHCADEEWGGGGGVDYHI